MLLFLLLLLLLLLLLFPLLHYPPRHFFHRRPKWHEEPRQSSCLQRLQKGMEQTTLPFLLPALLL